MNVTALKTLQYGRLAKRCTDPCVHANLEFWKWSALASKHQMKQLGNIMKLSPHKIAMLLLHTPAQQEELEDRNFTIKDS